MTSSPDPVIDALVGLVSCVRRVAIVVDKVAPPVENPVPVHADDSYVLAAMGLVAVLQRIAPLIADLAPPHVTPAPPTSKLPAGSLLR